MKIHLCKKIKIPSGKKARPRKLNLDLKMISLKKNTRL